MNSTAEQITMSHKLTPAKQNDILSRAFWTPDGRVRLQCTHRTEPLLRAAGVSHPRPLETYPVSVRRDSSGFLVIDHDAHAPQTESDAHLYDPGGLFAGSAPPAPAAAQATQRTEIPPAFALELREALRIRRFEIPTGDSTRVRIEVLTYQDKAMPAPMEPEQWKSREPSDAEIIAAAHALMLSRQLAHYEK